MYRAQRIAEYALYDNDPTLMDSELDLYLSITPEQIRSSVERFLDVENRVVLGHRARRLASEEASPKRRRQRNPPASRNNLPRPLHKFRRDHPHNLA